MQSSVSVSMWFMWIITGLSESYKVLHKISNKELQSKEKFHFETLTRKQSESFSLNLFCQICKPFVFVANIFKLHSPLSTFLSSRAWLSQLDLYERPNSHKQSESFSLNLFCQICKPFVFVANIFKLHSPLSTFLSSRAWLSQLDLYERPNSHKLE